jgi:phosphate starvation-inducible PhoH-like protein
MSRRRKTQERHEAKEFSGFKPRSVTARSYNQKAYIKAIAANDITFCYGPAGSGKTHIAVGMAVQAMRHHDVERIAITRPTVAVGNDIGYLPGTMEEKVSPYLVPLFDELSYYCEQSLMKRWLAEKKLEIVPLTMMRGRTFNDTFVILDEAQNATMGELRMFLTRIGANATMVLVGDIHQSDLHRDLQGSFEFCIERLGNIEGIGICELQAEDIVRHRLISTIENRLAS